MNFRRTEWSQFLFPLKLESQPQEERLCSRHREETLATSHQDLDFKPSHFQVWQISLFMEAQWGDVCRDTCHPEKALFSFNSSSCLRKTKKSPRLPPPAITPQANTNLTPRVRAAPHWGHLSAGSEDGRQAFELQVFRQPGDGISVPVGVPPEGARGEREATQDSSGEHLWPASTWDSGPQDHSRASAFEDSVSCCWFQNDFLASCRWPLLRQFCSSWLLFSAK